MQRTNSSELQEKQPMQCTDRRVRTLVSDPVTSSLDNAAAGAAGVSVSNAAEPAAAAEAAADAALAGARRAGFLAVAFGGGGGASGATVADADMGAMDGFGCSAGRAVYLPALRFRPQRQADTLMLKAPEIFKDFRPQTWSV
jgi:hypothetical protein